MSALRRLHRHPSPVRHQTCAQRRHAPPGTLLYSTAVPLHSQVSVLTLSTCNLWINKTALQ